jgi:hypothetical protein
LLGGFDAADRFLANAGAGGQLGLGPARGLATADDLPGDDDAGGFDRRVMAVLVGRRQRRQIGASVLKQSYSSPSSERKRGFSARSRSYPRLST